MRKNIRFYIISIYKSVDIYRHVSFEVFKLSEQERGNMLVVIHPGFVLEPGVALLEVEDLVSGISSYHHIVTDSLQDKM